MAEPIDLNLQRLRQKKNSTDITPRELVSLMADVLDRNEISGTPIRMIALIEFEEDDCFRTQTFRSGCTRYEEIALAELFRDSVMRMWAE